MALEAEPANFCAAMARRLLEIARRNEIRQEAGLPLLPVVQELRKMKRQVGLEESERFAAVHHEAILEQVLKPRRDDNPNWRPNFLENMGYQNQIHKILWERFRAARKRSNVGSDFGL